MGVLSSLYVTLGLNADGFTSGMQQVSSSINTGLREANQGLGGFRRLGNQMASVGQQMAIGVTAPLAGLAALALKSTADIQALSMGLEAVMGSAEGAARELGNLEEVAKLPGLGFEEAIQGSVRLQAVGFSAESARAALMGFGNAIATTGGGRAELDRVITQLTQMASAGKLLTQDLRPVIQTVPLLGGVLLDLYGTIDAATISEDLAAQGKSTTDFVSEVTTELGKLPAVTGGLKNAFENLGDTVKQSLDKIGTAIAPIAETAIPLLATAIASAATAFSSLNPALQSAAVAAAAVAAALGPLLLVGGNLITSFMSLKAVMIAMGASGGGFAVFGGAASGLVAALTSPAGLVAVIGVALVGAIVLAKNSFVNMDTILETHRKKIVAVRDAYKSGKLKADEYRDAIGDLDPKIRDADKAQQDAADSAWDLHGKVVELKKELENQGIEVDETGKSLEDYYEALKEAKKQNEDLPAKLQPATDAIATQAEEVESLEEWYTKYLAATVRPFEPPTGKLNDFTQAIKDSKDALQDEMEKMVLAVGPVDSLGTSFSDLEGFITDSAEQMAADVPAFEEAATKTDTAWSNAMQNVSTNITNAAQDIVGILVGTKEGSIGDAFKKLGASVLTTFTEPVVKAINDLISGALTKLIGKLLGGDGVMGAFGKIGDAVSGMFTGGGGAASGAVGGAGSAAGGLGGAAGGLGSAMSGVAGMVNLVSGVVSAVASVASFIQGFEMEDTMDAVEEESRKNQLHNLFSLEKMNEYLPKLADIHAVLLSWGGDGGIFGQINESIRDMRTGGLSEVRIQLVDAIHLNTSTLGTKLDTIAMETRGVAAAITQNNTFNLSGGSANEIADAIALRLQRVSV